MASPAADKIKSLNATLMRARYAYYVEARPIMEDSAYDALEKELKDLVTQNPKLAPVATVLTSVGSDVVGTLGTAQHREPMQSLENAYTWEDVEKWAKDHPANATYVIEPKVDGCSLSIRYTDYKFWVALTRGSGTVGEDVTQAALTILDIPKTLPPSCPPDLEIRGEVFMTQGVFDTINAAMEKAGEKTYANPRNLAAGSLKTKDVRKVAERKLSFLPWQVIGLEPKTGIVPDPANPAVTEDQIIKAPFGLEHTQALEYVHRLCGTRQPQSWRVYSRDGLKEGIEKCRILRDTLWKQGMGMPTDGVVIKVEEQELRKQLGLGTSSPKWAIAYKYPAERATTSLKDVTWQVGRTGRLTPVAELEPILVSGSTISRVNLNNLSYIRKDLGDPHLGDRVVIYKGGDVIPQLAGIASQGEIRIQIIAPTLCPECQQPILEETDKKSGILSHTCTNPACPGRLISHFTYIGKRDVLDIEGLGDALAEQFVRQGVTPSLGHLWAWGLEAEQAMGIDAAGFEAACADAGYSVAQIRDITTGLARTRTSSWDKWLQALGIPGIARETAKSLAAHLGLLSEDLPVLAEKLMFLVPGTVEGIGPERIKSIQVWAADPSIQADMQLLYASGVRPASTIALSTEGLPLSGYVIVITGEFGVDRDKVLVPLLESLGAAYKSGMSKKVNLLLVGDTGVGKTKITKAEEYGVRVENRPWLEAVLKAAGKELGDAGMPSDEEMMEEL